MNCARCGNEFTGRKRKYCTKDCCLRAHGHDPDYKPESLCLSCGKVLSEGQKKYCSGACVSRAYYKRKHPDSLPQPERREVIHKQHIEKTRKICRQCEKYFTMQSHSKGMFCSYECRGKFRSEQQKKQREVKPIKHCKICGKETQSRREVYCSDECRKVKARRDSLESNKQKRMLVLVNGYICKECGESFTPKYGSKRRSFCSATCYKRNERRERHWSRGSYKRYKTERDGERFKVRDIYDRDRWVCGICNGKVDKRLKYPHPMSASLDHILPIAEGGAHTKANVQLAHLSCNVAAGVGGVKQLRMFG